MLEQYGVSVPLNATKPMLANALVRFIVADTVFEKSWQKMASSDFRSDIMSRKRFPAGKLINAVQKFAVDCLEHEDLRSLYRFCEQFGEIMQAAENEALLEARF